MTLASFLYAIGKVFRRRGDGGPSPTILPIVRRPKSLEELLNENCALHQKLRERTRLANDVAAKNAVLRRRAEQAEMKAAIGRQSFANCTQALEQAAQRGLELRKLARKLIAEVRVHRGALDDEILVLHPCDGLPPLAGPTMLIASTALKNRAGALAYISIASGDRHLIQLLFERLDLIDATKHEASPST